MGTSRTSLFIAVLGLVFGQPLPAQVSSPSSGLKVEPTNLGELTMPAQALTISKAPPAGTALLAGLPACERAPIFLGSRRLGFFAPPGDACVRYPGATTDGRIAPREWVVETNGGIEPVTLTATTPQTPLLSGLFTVLRGTSDTLVTSTSAARESFDTAQQRGQPAGRHTWRIRFAGMAFDPSTAPREMVVVISAKDGAGATKATDFRLFPYSPRIVAASTTGLSPLPMRPINLSLQLGGLGKASDVTFLSDTGAVGHCYWSELGQGPVTNPSQGHTLQQGVVRVDETPVTVGPYATTWQTSRQGVFVSGTQAVPATTCRPQFKLRVRFDRSTVEEPAVIVTAPGTIQLGARVLYTISGTAALRDKLGLFDPVKVTQYMGNCTGTSKGLAGDFAVGRHHVDGDLSFRIRSGPLGTDCLYADIRTATNPVVLPPGIMLAGSTWSTSSTSKCRVLKNTGGDETFDMSRTPWTMAPDSLGSVWGIDKVLKYVDPDNSYSDPGVVIHEANFPGFRTALRSVTVHLKCDVTATNDHEVRATLKEVVLSGPEGWAGL